MSLLCLLATLIRSGVHLVATGTSPWYTKSSDKELRGKCETVDFESLLAEAALDGGIASEHIDVLRRALESKPRWEIRDGDATQSEDEAAFLWFPAGFLHYVPSCSSKGGVCKGGVRVTSLAFVGYASRMTKLEEFLRTWLARMQGNKTVTTAFPTLPMKYDPAVDEALRKTGDMLTPEAAAELYLALNSSSSPFTQCLRRACQAEGVVLGEANAD